MKRFLSLLCLVALTLGLSACAGFPTAGQVGTIQAACALDAGLRPTVDVLLALPGLATVQEVSAIGAARAVIDPVCANPSGSYEANTVAAVTGAAAKVASVVVDLQARKNHPPAPSPAASAAVSMALIPRVTA